MECLKCSRRISKKDTFVTCSECKKKCHSTCSKLNQDEIKNHTGKGTNWYCKLCKNHQGGEFKQKNMLEQTEMGMGDSTIRGPINKKPSIKVTEKGDIPTSGFNNNLQNIQNEEKDEDPKPLENKSELRRLKQAIGVLTSQNQILQRDIKILNYKLEIAEQTAKKNILEITGVPDQKDENILNVVKQIGLFIGYEVKDEMIDICFRVTRVTRPGCHGILVYFVRRFDKDGFLKSYHMVKGLTPNDIGRNGDYKIYIRECLSFANRRLFIAARKEAKKHNFNGVGIFNGEVYMKKPNGPAYLIKDLTDIEKAINSVTNN